MKTLDFTITAGMNTRALLWVARQLGFEIVNKRGNPDVMLKHPLLPRIITLSTSRKDSSRAAFLAVKRVHEMLATSYL